MTSATAELVQVVSERAGREGAGTNLRDGRAHHSFGPAHRGAIVHTGQEMPAAQPYRAPAPRCVIAVFTFVYRYRSSPIQMAMKPTSLGVDSGS